MQIRYSLADTDGYVLTLSNMQEPRLFSSAWLFTIATLTRHHLIYGSINIQESTMAVQPGSHKAIKYRQVHQNNDIFMRLIRLASVVFSRDKILSRESLSRQNFVQANPDKRPRPEHKTIRSCSRGTLLCLSLDTPLSLPRRSRKDGHGEKNHFGGSGWNKVNSSISTNCFR
jgi:hypothetical protein